MTYLLRHPKSHVYFLRRVVPPALREAVGRREIRRSLRIRDLAEAKRRLVAAAAEVDRPFAEAERRHAEGAPPSITLEDARNWAEDRLKRELKKIEAHAATRGRRPIDRDELGVSEERLDRLWPVAGLEPFVPMAPLAFEKYAAEANLRPQTLSEFTTALRRFREVVGGDPPVRTRSARRMCGNGRRRCCACRAASPSRTGVYRSPRSCRPVERVSSGTVAKMMTALQAVMGWAVRNGFRGAKSLPGHAAEDRSAYRAAAARLGIASRRAIWSFVTRCTGYPGSPCGRA